MANNINPININSQAINFAGLKAKEKEAGKTAEEEKNPAPAPSEKNLNAADVLGFMAAQSVDVQPKKAEKVLDVSKYVTPEQAERIAGFIHGFESEVEKGLKAFDSEFPNAGISKEEKLNTVVTMFEKTNM